MKARLFTVLFLVLVLAGGPVAGALPEAQDNVSLRYQSQPDDVVLYLGDLAYARDTVTLPPGEVEVNFPPNVIADSLVVSENGARVGALRFHNRSAANFEMMMDSRSMPTTDMQAMQLSVSWPSEATEAREVVLEYLMRGAGWRPVYDMTILDEDSVFFNFSAEISNYAMVLEDANVRLLSGMIITGDMGVSTADMTVTQNAFGYENVGGEMPSAEQISAHHVYDLGKLTILPGDVVRAQLVNEELGARRLIAWDTRQGNRTEVIYKVANTTSVPFAQGNVRTYEDGIYMGVDAIEWTPVGSEGSVTVAGMTDVRVRRQESVEEIGQVFHSVERYRYTVSLEVGNYSGEAIDITVLDPWKYDAQEFSFSMEPTRQPENLLRWDITVPAGERVTIRYEFIVD